MHRPLPEGFKIQRAIIVRNRVGTFFEDELQITLTKYKDVPGADYTQQGEVGIDFGWRLTNDRTTCRAAYRFDSSHNSNELTINLSSFQYVQDIKSTCENNKNQMVKELKLLIKILRNEKDTPEWFKEDTKTIDKWKSASRFARFARKWRTQGRRFKNDEEAYKIIEEWRYHNFYLYNMQTHLHRKAIRRRRDEYQCFAKKLATTYAVVKIEDTGVKALAKKKPFGQDIDSEYGKFARQCAAIGELKTFIEQACIKYGTELIKVPPAYTTKKCHACEKVDKKWENPGEQTHTCIHCGEVWDRDENAAINICHYQSRAVK